MMQTTQTWCEDNHLTLSAPKSHVIVFHETRATHRLRGDTQWIIHRKFPLHTTPLTITEVSLFCYIGITVAPTLTFDHHCTKIIHLIHMGTNHLLFAREATPSLRTNSAMILYRLWVSTVTVHVLSNLIPLRAARHLNLLQVTLNVSLTRVFGVPTVPF